MPHISHTSDCLYCVIDGNSSEYLRDIRKWQLVWWKAFGFVNTIDMSVGRKEYAMARRKWDLGTIFGIPKSCLQPQYPRNLYKNNLIGASKFLAAKLHSLVNWYNGVGPSDIPANYNRRIIFLAALQWSLIRFNSKEIACFKWRESCKKKCSASVITLLQNNEAITHALTMFTRTWWIEILLYLELVAFILERN